MTEMLSSSAYSSLLEQLWLDLHILRFRNYSRAISSFNLEFHFPPSSSSSSHEETTWKTSNGGSGVALGRSSLASNLVGVFATASLPKHHTLPLGGIICDRYVKEYSKHSNKPEAGLVLNTLLTGISGMGGKQNIFVGNPSCHAMIVNSPSHSTRKPNCSFSFRRGEFCLVLDKALEEGDELLVSYGGSYTKRDSIRKPCLVCFNTVEEKEGLSCTSCHSFHIHRSCYVKDVIDLRSVFVDSYLFFAPLLIPYYQQHIVLHPDNPFICPFCVVLDPI